MKTNTRNSRTKRRGKGFLVRRRTHNGRRIQSRRRSRGKKQL